MPTEQEPLIIHYSALKNIPVPIQALCEAGLSPTQWTLLYLMAHPELRTELLAMIHCPNKPLLWTNEDMQDLLERFYIINEPVPNAPSKTDLVNFRVSVRFTDLLSTLKEAWLPAGHYQLSRPIAERGFTPHAQAQEARRKAKDILNSTPTFFKDAAPAVDLDELEAFDALFQAYPSHIPVNGTLMSGRGGDYDGMAAIYARALNAKSSPAHATILELVAWARQQSLLTMGLKKFLDSREWLGLQELRDQGFAGSTFDSQTAI